MAVASPPRRRAKRTTNGGPARAWWWGEGPPPGERWPGVTVEFPSVWRTATNRWESPDGTYFFDMEAADRAVGFFPDLLTHHIGEFAGRPFELLEYQKKLLTRPLFGWKRTSDGLRRIRKMFAFIPKGGGKSPWAAGTGVYLARCDDEMAAEVYAVANDRTQARTVHTNAKYMVEDSPLLSDGVTITKDAIYWEDTRSTYMVLSSDASSAHGKRPSGVIVDELHGFSGDNDRELFEALRKSMIKRRQPVLMMVSHAGTDDESLCHEEYEYAKALMSGAIQDDTSLPVIFEATSADDWSSPEVHARVNPGYGVTVKADAVEMECLEALNEPRKRNDFLRYHLNRWVNQATSWLPIEWWDACAEPMPSDEVLRTLPCAAGLDLAMKYDLACLSLVFRQPAPRAVKVEVVAGDEPEQVKSFSVDLNYRLIVVPFFWIPEDTMRQREKDDLVPYSSWADGKLVRPTEGAIIDYAQIYRDITTEIVPRFPMLKQGIVGYDPAFATDIASSLRDRGGLKVEEILQNYKYMSEPCYVLEALIKAGMIVHGGHRVLRNHVENVSVKTDDARRIRPVKPKRASKHIDGVVATLMGLRSVISLVEPPKFQMFFVGGR